MWLVPLIDALHRADTNLKQARSDASAGLPKKVGDCRNACVVCLTIPALSAGSAYDKTGYSLCSLEPPAEPAQPALHRPQDQRIAHRRRQDRVGAERSEGSLVDVEHGARIAGR